MIEQFIHEHKIEIFPNKVSSLDILKSKIKATSLVETSHMTQILSKQSVKS